MRFRKILIPIALAVVAGVALALWVRNAPPRPARMLPDADAYVYFDFRPMRAAGLFDRLPNVQLDPEYQDFVNKTGIHLEHDLDQAAFAVHLAQAGQETRSSEVFVGSFDPEKLRSFLQGIAASSQQYSGKQVFEVPLPGRTVRAAILDSWGLGASNTAAPDAIHHILDSQSAWFHSTPPLLRSYYPQVPVGSPVWAVVRETSQNGKPTLTLPGGFQIAVPKGTVLVASLRYTGTVDFRAEAFTSDAASAEQLASHLGTYLTVLRAVRSRVQVEGAGAEFQKFLESIQLEKHENGVLLTASASPKLLQEIFASAGEKQAPKP
jgi:hypothetical protein